MGACLNRPKPTRVTTSTPMQGDEPPKGRSRQRLSVLQVEMPNQGSGPVSQEQFMQLYNRRGSGKFQRKQSTGDAHAAGDASKEEQGTVLLINHKVMIEGTLSNHQQQNFEDKQRHITGDSIPDRFLDDYGLAVSCKKGLKPESPNQDDFCLLIDGRNVILGVFDGHGPYGHHVSDHIHALLPRLINKHELLDTDAAAAMTESFKKAHESLIMHCEHPDTRFDCVISGSTASVLIIRPEEILVGFVGDSRAILSRKEGEARKAVILAPDHKPTNPGERERVERSGGEVKKLPFDIPFRVFFKGKEYPGLSMSRAIGDTMAQEIGVTWMPEVKSFPTTELDEFVIVCSDGVWEFISNEEAIALVANYGKSKVRQAAEQLAKLAWSRWIHNEGETVDDITVLIAFLPVSRTH